VWQTSLLLEKARATGFEVTAPESPDERGGAIAIRCPNPGEVSAELLRREFLVDYRPGAGIRVAPHFYTSDDELESVIREMRQILDSGDWRRHAGEARYVT
jgi:kynureninase